MPKQGDCKGEHSELSRNLDSAVLVLLPICFKIKARSVNNFKYLVVWQYESGCVNFPLSFAWCHLSTVQVVEAGNAAAPLLPPLSLQWEECLNHLLARQEYYMAPLRRNPTSFLIWRHHVRSERVIHWAHLWVRLECIKSAKISSCQWPAGALAEGYLCLPLFL